MNTVTKIKKTNQTVYPMGSSGSMHTLVLKPFDFISKRGSRGELMRVKNSNLISVNEYAG